MFALSFKANETLFFSCHSKKWDSRWHHDVFFFSGQDPASIAVRFRNVDIIIVLQAGQDFLFASLHIIWSVCCLRTVFEVFCLLCFDLFLPICSNESYALFFGWMYEWPWYSVESWSKCLRLTNKGDLQDPFFFCFLKMKILDCFI